MKIKQKDTAIYNFHNYVIPFVASKQQQNILDSMEMGRDYTIGEIASITGMQKSSISARRYEMIARGLVSKGKDRICAISGRICETIFKLR